MKHVVIVGGGISGLVAAYRMQGLVPGAQITLVEREARLGGKIATERHEGFIIEGGPDCFLARKPRGLALCEEMGLLERLQGRDEAHPETYVLREGTLHRLPEGLTGLVPTNLDALADSTLISPDGQARLAQEPTLPPAPDEGDESVAHFATRRLGAEVFEQLVEPLLAGIYGGDASQLSLSATFPQLRQLERTQGSLLRGLQAGPGGGAATAYPPFVAFRSGMGEWVERLAERLTATTRRLGVGVTAVQPAGAGYTVALDDGSQLPADALILTTPAFVTARLLAPWEPALAAAHAEIPYGSVATVSLAYDEAGLPRPLQGRGYVIPRVEGTEVLACTWSSNKWAGRAPEGFALLRVYLGRYGGRDLLQEADNALVQMARDELARTLNLSVAPLFHRLYRWPHSMPQYTLGHPQRLALIEERLTHHPALFLAGAAYRGVGLPDCIHSAEQAAHAAARWVSNGRG